MQQTPKETTNIVMVVPYRFVPPINGGHKAAFGFCDFLARERDLVCVSTTNNKKEQPPFRLKLLFKDVIYKYFNPVVAWRCFLFFRREKIRICITHQPFIALNLYPVIKLLGIKLIVYVQNIEYQRFRKLGKWWWPILYFIEIFIYKKADHLFFISVDDLRPATDIFKLPEKKTSVIPYGTYRKEPPKDQEAARKSVIKKHQFNEDDFLIIFFGSQTYQSNLEAVKRIVHHINPLMLKKAKFNYRFLICGGGLPQEYNKLVDFPNVSYLGFVEDIELYVKAADVMINPVKSGGGMKTKIIEAIALGLSVVSSQTGAMGIDKEATKPKLIEVEDEDYDAFFEELIRIKKKPPPQTPLSFYNTYYWAKTILPALKLIE